MSSVNKRKLAALNTLNSSSSSNTAISGNTTSVARSATVKQFQQSTKYTNLIIKCENVELYVNQADLERASPVFSAMLSQESGFVESLDNSSIVIQDVLVEELAEFFTLICSPYLLQAEVSRKNVVSLYKLSDRFDVQALNNRCKEFILKHFVQIDFFVDLVLILPIAIRLKSAELIAHCVSEIAIFIHRGYIVIPPALFAMEDAALKLLWWTVLKMGEIRKSEDFLVAPAEFNNKLETKLRNVFKDHQMKQLMDKLAALA